MISDKESLAWFIDEAKLINECYPKLSLKFDKDKPYITGTIDLIESEQIITDSYEIEIFWSRGYPYTFPLVFEIGGRIPINLDWHKFETDGHCCLKAIPDEILLCKKGINLKWFISTQLIPYFFNQSFRQENGYYYHERSHGIKGTIESFEEIFKTTDISSILKLLSTLEAKADYKGTAKCPCGSKRKYKKCHRRTIRSVSAFQQYNISYIIRQIQVYQNLQSH